jgi:mRNA-degrading endonuclease RelE of RelBE toxin-antitoxin system
MRISWDQEALRELDEVKNTVRQQLKQNIEELEENPLPGNSYAIKLSDGTEIQRLKLQEEDRNSDLNHRVTYYIENREVRIYGIFDRKPGYQTIKQKTQERK